MSLESEAALDTAINSSRLHQILGIGLRIGGVITAAVMNYKHGPDTVPNILLETAPGALATGIGIRLGMERGAARLRQEQRDSLGTAIAPGESQLPDYVGVTEEDYVAATTDRVGAKAVEGFAPFTAAMSAITASNVTHEIPSFAPGFTSILFGATTAAFVTAGEVSMERAGRSTEMRPLASKPLVKAISWVRRNRQTRA